MTFAPCLRPQEADGVRFVSSPRRRRPGDTWINDVELVLARTMVVDICSSVCGRCTQGSTLGVTAQSGARVRSNRSHIFYSFSWLSVQIHLLCTSLMRDLALVQ